MTDTNTTPETETQAPSLDLNINDLGTLKNIIDLASSRGAFKPSEMTVVGQTYTRLATFLEHVMKQQAAQQETQQNAEGTE